MQTYALRIFGNIPTLEKKNDNIHTEEEKKMARGGGKIRWRWFSVDILARRETQKKTHGAQETRPPKHKWAPPSAGGQAPPAPPRSKKIILGGARFFCFFFQIGKLK